MTQQPVRVLTISGSLRATSSNGNVLAALALLAPAGVLVTRYRSVGDLPHFNPDRDAEGMIPPPAVAGLRDAVAQSDAVVICSPEYAHGVPGSLKNALDWLVSGVEILDKPVALLNLSPLSTHAQAALRETLTTMCTRVIDAASPVVPLAGRRLTAAEIAADPLLRGLLLGALQALVSATRDGTLP